MKCRISSRWSAVLLATTLSIASLGQVAFASDDANDPASRTVESSQSLQAPEANQSLSDAEIDALQRARVPASPSATTFAGRVTDQAGNVISGVSLNMWNQTDECNQDWGQLQIQPPDSCFRDIFASDGTFSTSLPDGWWGGNINPPAGSAYASVNLNVMVSAGTVEVDIQGRPYCGGDADEPCGSSVSFVLLRANFDAIVVDGSGTPVQGAWVNVEQWSSGGTSEGSYPWTPVGGADSQRTDPEMGGDPTATPGLISLPLPEATYYKLDINKPWDGDYDVANTRYYIKVTQVPSSGNITSASLCSWSDNGPQTSEPQCSGALPSSNGRFVLKMDTPNFKLQVCMPGSGAGCSPVGAWVTYEICTDDGDFGRQCSWGGGTEADESGHGSLFLTESGLYQFRLEPSWDYSGSPIASTTITAEVTVSGSGAPSVSGITQDGTGRYVLRFESPNIVGSLLYPDDGSNLANKPVGHSWIEVLRWDSDVSRYEWSQDIRGGNTNESGEFALALPAGDYRLNFPGQDGYATRAMYVHVDSASKACEGGVVESDVNELGWAPSGSFTCSSAATFYGTTLALPNVRGVLFAGLEPVRWGHINIERWNAEYNHWQWSGSWMNTDEDGRFATKFDTNGVYRLGFNPPWDSTEYAATNRYVVVCSGGSALAYAASQAVATEWDCTNPTSPMSTTLTDDVQLDGANFIGRVVFEGAGLPDVWIQVDLCAEEHWCQWHSGLQTRRAWGDPNSEVNGAFGGAISDNDASDSEASHFKVTLNPPPTDAGVVRAKYDVYVYSGWADGRSWCLGDDNYSEPEGVPTCAAGALYDESTPVTLTMKAGNMPGRVVTPDADCSSSVDAESCPGIRDSWIEVQQWKAFTWNTNEYGWEWTDLGGNSYGWGNADRIGNFNLDLPPSEGSALNYFRVTANPSWDNGAGYAKRTVVVAVNSDGNWCQMTAAQLATMADNSRSMSTPFSQSCTPDGSNDNADDAVRGLTARLVDANVRGILYAPDGETPVGDAHIGIERITEQNWCGVRELQAGDPDEDEDGIADWCIGEWSEWLGGSNTQQRGTNKGQFAISIVEPGKYRFRVETPWNWTGDLEIAPFRVDFEIAESATCVIGNTDPEACDITGISAGENWTYDADSQRFTAVYPTPTLYGTLLDQTGASPVRGGWLSIHNTETGNWVDGTGTGWDGPRKGRFAISLDDGTYEVEFWPAWDDVDSGVRNIVAITVADGVATMTSDGGAYNGGCPEGTAVSNQDTCLRTPAINGPVLYREDDCTSSECATRMPFAHAEAVVCEDGERPWECDWVDWGNTEEDTETRPAALRMALGDGTYTLRVFPNWDVKQTREMELAVVIADGTLSDCEYSFGGNCYVEDDEGNKSFAADFDAVPPNVFLRVDGVDGHTIESSRYVLIEACPLVSYSDETCAVDLVEEGRFLAKYSTLREKPTLDLFMDFGDEDPSDNDRVLDVSAVYKVTLLTLNGTDDENSSGKVAWVTQPRSTDDGDARLTTLTASAAS